MPWLVEGCRALLPEKIHCLPGIGWIIVLCAMPVHGQQLRLDEWQSKLNLEHPLVGKIWSSAEKLFIDENDLYEKFAHSRCVLRGEKHDNPDHHQIHQNLVTRLLSERRLEIVSMEMLQSSQQTLLDELTANPISDEEQIKTQLQWDEEGWDWSFYGPMLLAILKHNVVVQAANITREQMLDVYQGELDPVVASVLNAAAVHKLNEDIDESHCGLLPESQFPSMVRVQQARDFQMAQSLQVDIAGTNSNETVGDAGDDADKIRLLIAGNYHIRRDLSVPNYLLFAGAATEQEIVSVAFLEVETDVVDSKEYLEKFSATEPYDYIWFTPAISDEDYCASLRESAK